MKSIKQITKEEEILSLERQVAVVNNQISTLEEKSVELSQKIIMAKRQLELIKGMNNGS